MGIQILGSSEKNKKKKSQFANLPFVFLETLFHGFSKVYELPKTTFLTILSGKNQNMYYCLRIELSN